MQPVRLSFRLRAFREKRKSTLDLAVSRLRIALPYLCTFGNACLGLLAVLYALDELPDKAAYCIIGSALFDMLDGRLARAFNVCSPLGMELDSLCDAVSFCFAPAILLYSFYISDYGIMSILVISAYLCCGLFRLAKFNNTAAAQKSFFIGMPTPVPAIVCALLIAYHDVLTYRALGLLANPYVIMGILAICSYLMVSSIRFPSGKDGIFTYHRTTCVFAATCGGGLFAAWNSFPLFIAMLLAYIVSTIIYDIYGRMRSRTKKRPA